MPGPSTYWQTVRHLQPVQIYGRVWFKTVRPRRPSAAPLPLRKAQGPWITPPAREPILIGSGHVRLFGVERRIVRAEDWDAPADEKLWRYHLHYFDDLAARDACERRAWQREFVARWITENPVARGTGWEPYPTSRRIVNWIKWAMDGEALTASALSSLATQSRWLERRIEYHLRGNHLIANAKALVFAGLFFDGPEADRWLNKGLRLLEREIPEQVLADGGHFERSPMYHALVLEDLLDLCNILRVIPASRSGEGSMAAWQGPIARMRTWLRAMCHPDGNIGFFNDAALGMAPAPDQLETYADQLGCGSVPTPKDGLTRLDPSGYVRVQTPSVVALLDLAPIGPDYLPGHAHADTLSFELSLFGRRVLVNSGTSCYGGGAERLRQRGTAAHNTVIVNSTNSSEVWGGFRVGRRARPLDIHAESGEQGVVVRGAHDGYCHLRGRPIHRREWRFEPGSLTVDDRVDGSCDTAESLWHLAPGIPAPNPEGEASVPGGSHRLRWRFEGADVRSEPGSYHPEFGVGVSNERIRATFRGPACSLHLGWR